MILKKRHILSSVLLLLCSSLLFAQDDITISPVWTLNSASDEIMCTSFMGNMIIASNKHDVNVDDRFRINNNFILFEISDPKGNYTFTIDDEILEKKVSKDLGSAYYEEESETLWFSSVYNYNGEKGKTVKLYSMKKGKRGWSRPKSFLYNSNKYSIAHPWMNEDGTQLFFSSDREGGAGGMDLWFCNKLSKSKWSEPIWLGNKVNSSRNEIFPTIHDGDIYFSSDRNEATGLDIYRAFRVHQWEKIEKLREPINSDEDDLQMIFSNENSGFITSRREYGQGGDDIYFFKIRKKTKNNKNLSFLLQFKDTPMENTHLLVTNEEDYVRADVFTDNKGEIPLNDLDLKEIRKIFVLDVPDKFLKDCILFLIDENGEKVRSYTFGKDGFFKFEYLPLDYIGMVPRLSTNDESLLNLMVEGQVYAETPGDVGEGHAVYITDTNGELLALSYTQEEGKFNLSNITPLREYQLKFEANSGIKNILLDDGNEEKIIPVNKDKGYYSRFKDDEGIRLVDENKKPIFIGKDEVFIIKNIYYLFDKSELNDVAKSQLSDLAAIMRNNPSIEIELSSHTDSRGTTMYNYQLSKDRSNLAANYVSELGVARSRIISKGYGEAKLINHCKDDVECSDLEHALNRRTEIKILVD